MDAITGYELAETDWLAWAVRNIGKAAWNAMRWALEQATAKSNKRKPLVFDTPRA